MNKCKFIKPDKNQCNAFAIKGDDYCFFHSEKQQKARSEAVMKGGKSLKRSYGNSEPVIISNAGDVVRLLEDTINDLRQNKISNKSANTIGFLASNTMKAFLQKRKEENDKIVDKFTEGIRSR